MEESSKKSDILEIIRSISQYVSSIISLSLVSPMEDGAEAILKKTDEKIKNIEDRILKKLVSIIFVITGCIILANGVLFLLIEELGWSKSASFSIIGVLFVSISILIMATDHGR